MYNGGMGYNTGYVDTMAVGGVRPYYNQPMAMGPNVVVVDNNYGYGGGYGGGYQAGAVAGA